MIGGDESKSIARCSRTRFLKTHRHSRAATRRRSRFKANWVCPIHRWYRLTPSFSPHLADDIAKHFGLRGHDYVLDPFSGVGTVPLCMSHRGIPSCSIEINPFLYFVGTVKTRRYDDLAAIAACFDGFECRYPTGTAKTAR